VVSPRTPLTKARYGPTGGVGGSSSVVVVGNNLLRKRVGHLGIEGAGSKNSFDFNQNNSSSSDSEWDVVQEVISDDVLVERARKAFERAERKGDGEVELEGREWEAWQRHEAMEREIERRVVERLEVEKRRKITVSASSPRLPTRPVGASVPGILTGEGFTPLDGSPRMASQLLPKSASNTHIHRDPIEDSFVPEITPSMSPPLLSGAFPDDPESEPLSRPIHSSIRHASPVSLSTASTQLTSNYRSQLAAKASLPGRWLSPQPGSSYYSSKHPILTSKSDLDLSRPDYSDGDEGSILSVRSTASSSSETHARRKKRAELRAELGRGPGYN